MRVVIWKHFLRSRGAADVIVFFQKQNTQACAPKIARRHKTIVSCAEDYHIVLRFHGSMLTSNIAKQTSNISVRKDLCVRHESAGAGLQLYNDTCAGRGQRST